MKPFEESMACLVDFIGAKDLAAFIRPKREFLIQADINIKSKPVPPSLEAGQGQGDQISPIEPSPTPVDGDEESGGDGIARG